MRYVSSNKMNFLNTFKLVVKSKPFVLDRKDIFIGVYD